MREWFTYSNQCLLVNRETVQINAHIRVKYRHDPEYELSALADSLTNRWALGLAKATDAFSLGVRDSLKELLLNIASPRFRVTDVILKDLKPVIEHKPEPKPEPKPRELTQFEKAINEMNERANNLNGLNAWWDTYQKDHPEFCKTNDGQRLKGHLELLKAQFVGEVRRGAGTNFGRKKPL